MLTPDSLTLRDRVAIAKRRPQRLTVTVSYLLAQRLQERADYQGRSLSNLAATLLEAAMESAARG